MVGSTTATGPHVDEDAVWQALREVPDPELPAISLVDLGVIAAVDLAAEARHVRVDLMPTWLGCPALRIMQELIRERLGELGLEVEVWVVRRPAWSSDRISAEGRQQLAAAGIAPPGPNSGGMIQLLEPAACPHCGSRSTVLDSAFGPTPCRAIARCGDCRQPFEQFKPI